MLDTGTPAAEWTSAKMGDYAFAVDDVARTLSAEERQTLRETGQVPDWFLGKVKEQFVAIRRARRR